MKRKGERKREGKGERKRERKNNVEGELKRQTFSLKTYLTILLSLIIMTQATLIVSNNLTRSTV